MDARLPPKNDFWHTESSPEGAMRPPHRILDRHQVHRLAAEHLQAHLQFKDYKRKTSAPVLWSLLLAAAARITSLSDACQRLRRRPLRRDGPQGAAGHPARLRRPATAAQRRAGRAPAQGAPQAPPAAGHRPDLDPLPRPALPRPRRDLPRPGQGRHQPLPRLRHRLRRPQGAAVHRRLDRRDARASRSRRWSNACSGRPRAWASGPGCSCWIAASTAWRWSATSRRRGTRS